MTPRQFHHSRPVQNTSVAADDQFKNLPQSRVICMLGLLNIGSYLPPLRKLSQQVHLGPSTGFGGTVEHPVGLRLGFRV